LNRVILFLLEEKVSRDLARRSNTGKADGYDSGNMSYYDILYMMERIDAKRGIRNPRAQARVTAPPRLPVEREERSFDCGLQPFEAQGKKAQIFAQDDNPSETRRGRRRKKNPRAQARVTVPRAWN
jgi:hypothetical protein